MRSKEEIEESIDKSRRELKESWSMRYKNALRGKITALEWALGEEE